MFFILEKEAKFYHLEEHFSPEEAWVLHLLFQDRNIPWDDSLGDENNAFEFAVRNGLAQLLYVHSSSSSLSEVVRSNLKKQYLSNLARNSTLQVISDEMMQALRKAGIPSIPLKGSFLSRIIYPDPALRPMSDIDLLVPADRVEEAFLMFATDPVALMKRDEFGHHLPPLMYRGAMIEIHNSLFDLNARYQIPINRVWENAEGSSEYGFLTMNPLHLITHLILHIYYSFRTGGIRLGWFYDLKVTMEFYKKQVTAEDLRKFFNMHQLEGAAHLVLAYYQFLNPNSNFQVQLDRAMQKQLSKIHEFTIYSAEEDSLKYGYSVAWERIRYSRNWTERMAFMKHLLLVDKSGEQMSFFTRIIYLIKNSLSLLWHKMKFW